MVRRRERMRVGGGGEKGCRADVSGAYQLMVPMLSCCQVQSVMRRGVVTTLQCGRERGGGGQREGKRGSAWIDHTQQ